MAFPTALTLTDAAAERVKALMAKAEGGVIGLRVGVKSRGCSGMSYEVEYATDVKKFEEVVEDKGVKILIDPKAVMFLLGSEMDWVDDKFNSRFEFRNPNEKGRCGCGESFHV
ncbi:MAG: Fe-S cluster assembly scaffold SufA [Rhodospirillales bacterium]|jgi:iron-sulfur cluster assembly protein|nr:Fe-S cluster assembly scaffold SufA [Rhodospirillales bacterium]